MHPFIYVLQQNTDDHGWQYRTDWSDGPLGPSDEPWVHLKDGRNVRRRLWMTTVVRQHDLLKAKRVLTEALQSHDAQSIIQRTILRKRSDGSWHKELVVMMDDKFEFFVSDSGGSFEKTGEVPLAECNVKMLFGSQCPDGREFTFYLRASDGSGVILDAESREGRRQLVVNILYQVAITTPDVNFQPFEYAPPTGDEGDSRILMAGDLEKQGHFFTNWAARYVTMTPKELFVSFLWTNS